VCFHVINSVKFTLIEISPQIVRVADRSSVGPPHPLSTLVGLTTCNARTVSPYTDSANRYGCSMSKLLAASRNPSDPDI